MSNSTRDLVKRLRLRIREFEDRKASAADLSREVFFVAKEFDGYTEGELRRTLERLGNRIAVLVERSLNDDVRADILNTVDQVEAELVERGY